METKYCKKCDTTKNVSEFSRSKNKNDGLQSFCKLCSSIKKKEHYEINKKDYFKKNKLRKEEIRKFVEEIKANNKCAWCPESDIACLDFHHEVDTSKDFSIAIAANRGYSLEKIKQEIDKCIILCSNCHRKFHYYNS